VHPPFRKPAPVREAAFLGAALVSKEPRETLIIQDKLG
jgi:hypothetical protein